MRSATTTTKKNETRIWIPVNTLLPTFIVLWFTCSLVPYIPDSRVHLPSSSRVRPLHRVSGCVGMLCFCFRRLNEDLGSTRIARLCDKANPHCLKCKKGTQLRTTTLFGFRAAQKGSATWPTYLYHDRTCLPTREIHEKNDTFSHIVIVWICYSSLNFYTVFKFTAKWKNCANYSN